jgi:hypothetical protein
MYPMPRGEKMRWEFLNLRISGKGIWPYSCNLQCSNVLLFIIAPAFYTHKIRKARIRSQVFLSFQRCQRAGCLSLYAAQARTTFKFLWAKHLLNLKLYLLRLARLERLAFTYCITWLYVFLAFFQFQTLNALRGETFKKS